MPRTWAGFVVLSFSIATASVLASTQGSKNATATATTGAFVVFSASDVSGPVPAISPESLEVHLNGKIVPADRVQPLAGEPLIFSMLVDVSASSRRFADKQVAAASELFRDLASDGGKGYLIVFGMQVVTANHFVNIDAVDNALKRLPAESRGGPTALYDALFYALTQQLGAGELPVTSRRAIFLFSDGGDNLSQHDPDAVIRAAQTKQVTIFSIGFSRDKSHEATREEADSRRELRALSQQTGGLVVFLDESDDPIAHVMHAVDQQYLLSFDPPSLKTGKLYRLTIDARDKAIRISAARNWFFQ